MTPKPRRKKKEEREREREKTTVPTALCVSFHADPHASHSIIRWVVVRAYGPRVASRLLSPAERKRQRESRLAQLGEA